MGAKAIAAAKEEKERLANHPLADELFANQKRLKALEELVKQYPNDKEIKNSYIIVKAIVNELIGFPTKLSAQTARSIAVENAKLAENAKDRMQATLQSRSEIEQL